MCCARSTSEQSNLFSISTWWLYLGATMNKDNKSGAQWLIKKDLDSKNIQRAFTE